MQTLVALLRGQTVLLIAVSLEQIPFPAVQMREKAAPASEVSALPDELTANTAVVDEPTTGAARVLYVIPTCEGQDEVVQFTSNSSLDVMAEAVVAPSSRCEFPITVGPVKRGKNPVVGVPEIVTVPEPAGVAHVPSPRQKVAEDAPVPEFRLVGGRLPVTPVDKGSPVALARTAEVGVPSAGVVSVGAVSVRPEIVVVVLLPEMDVDPKVIGNPVPPPEPQAAPVPPTTPLVFT